MQPTKRIRLATLKVDLIWIGLLSGFLLAVPLTSAVAQSNGNNNLDTVPCPKFIAFPQWGQFTQTRKNKNIVCLRKRKEAKKNFARCNKDCGPGFSADTESFFSMSESGPANTPAFSITQRSGLLFYEYDGEDGITIELIDFSNGKVVDKLVKTQKGPVSGSTYIHDRGTFYLKIRPDNATEATSWAVDFDIDP